MTLTGLVDDWWKEKEKLGKAKSTYVNYKGVFGRLVTFLEHDDAQRLTAKDVVRFKDYRLEEGISPRTVNDGDLAALRSVLGWAMDNTSSRQTQRALSNSKGSRRRMDAPSQMLKLRRC